MLARDKGFDEGVFLNLEGNVAEGPGENIFIIQNGHVKTNDTSESVLHGITRTSILKIAKDLGMPTIVGPITKEEFFTADEAFFSGTAVEITPIIKITDGSVSGTEEKEYTVGVNKPGPLTMELKKVFLETVQGNRPEYQDWLTYVNNGNQI